MLALSIATLLGRRPPAEVPAEFSPSELFAASEVGVWYDPSDFSTLFENTDGTGAISTVEKPVGKMLDKSGNGFHATAANNSTARPVLRSRYNLLTYSQAAFSNAAWSKTRTSIGSETITAPDSTSTASVLIEDTATGSHSTSQTNTMIAGASYVASVYAKDVDGQYLIISAANTTNASLYARAAFDLSVGTVANTAEAGTGYSVTQATIASVGSGWYRCTLKFVAGSTAPGSVFLGMSNTSSPGAYGLASYTGTSRSIYLWGAQLVANSVFPQNTYQRIAAATDYATGADFPPYLAFDGVDDTMSTASIDFSGSDAVTQFVGIGLNNITTNNIIAELGSANSAGEFGLIVNASSYLQSAMRGSLGTLAAASSVIRSNSVITHIGDISDDTNTLRANAVQIATNTGDLGSGNLASASTFQIAARGAQYYLNCSLYSLIVRGTTSTAQEIDDTEAWVANKTGVTL